LIAKSVEEFVEETASESPAPGGGSVAAAVGALGAALATMVANLSSHKRGWDDRWEEFSNWAEKGKHYYVELLHLVDEDTAAFTAVMAAYGFPQNSDAEKAARKQAIQAATQRAIEIPLKVMETALASMEVIKAMADTGNPNSVSDAGVAALCARTAVLGAFLNVKINASTLDDRAFASGALSRGEKYKSDAVAKEHVILESVAGRM